MMIESFEQMVHDLREFGITTETAVYADIQNGEMVKEYRVSACEVFSRTEGLWLREVPAAPIPFPDGLYQIYDDRPLPFVMLRRSGHPLRVPEDETGNNERVSE